MLVINPGSTSTKLAVFDGEKEIFQQTIAHSLDELKIFNKISEQKDFRSSLIRRFLADNNIILDALAAVVGRGGLLKPMAGGVYRVNQAMLNDLNSAKYGEHASNLGGILAFDIAAEAGCPAFIVDPVVVDELEDKSRVSGMPEIERKSIFHALNQKSAAREVALKADREYHDCNFIVAHLGGGITVGAHKKGRVIDVNNGLDGDGPFSPERTGGLPVGQLVEICFSGKYTLPEIKKKNVGAGGLAAYRGSNDFSELKSAMKSGDKEAELLFAAMVLQVSQEICKHGATLMGIVDAIILTGGMANDKLFVEKVSERVGHLAPVEIIPGEREMLSLARGALSVLRKQVTGKEYA